MGLVKLPKRIGQEIHYWEAWEQEDGSYLIHWGPLGERGSRKTIGKTLLKSAEARLAEEIKKARVEGFGEIERENHDVLLIEYAVTGFGTEADLDKRHRLEERLNETLGWTGLGHCDGGSIGSNRMEVCCLVVDFDLAKTVIETALKGSEFSDYTRIYRPGKP